MKETNCLVCQKHRGEVIVPGGIVYQDDLVCVSHSLMPEGQNRAYLGIYFVEPRRHATGWADLTDAEAKRMGLLIQRVSYALKESEGADHIYTFAFGHDVDHLHIWVVPRYPGTPREFWGTAVTDWPEAPRGNEAVITALCQRIRAHLSN